MGDILSEEEVQKKLAYMNGGGYTNNIITDSDEKEILASHVALRAERDEALRLLRKAEWNEKNCSWRCVWCHNMKKDGHTANCPYAALMKA